MELWNPLGDTTDSNVEVSSYSSYPHLAPLTCRSHILRHLFGELDQFHGSLQSSQQGSEFERL